MANCVNEQQLGVPDDFGAEAIRADLLKHAAPESSFPQEREQETHLLCSVDPYVTWSGLRYQLCILPYSLLVMHL